ncbi:YibL family ribosome-associated protein [Paraferrimonas sedimenticola]|uniref:Ribosome-associated protein n=1 Tax=Paraferrimonas sedimenticola TaxID=375674 RepID=A0AA37W0S0_9GAMM|nr:YibL family ribosome-associated protein [Paraferrimonas sedimenticola]GLP95442.1 hypothetical protein GCM10007895_07480 [Paraferrimonas sedimenticola]
MSVKDELQKAHNQLDKFRHKLTAAKRAEQLDVIAQIEREMKKLTAKINTLKSKQSKQLSAKGETITSMKFHRALTKEEQADMGKLKKSVKGLVVVHPMTALGRELGLEVATGYAPKKF